MALVLAAFLLLVEWGSAAAAAAAGEETCSGIVPMKERGTAMSVEDFGGVGDGRTLNTAAFEKAVAEIERRGVAGGTLYVPPGVWLTGVFNLTSHMTLFLARGAVIKATQVLSLFPPLFVFLIKKKISFSPKKDPCYPTYSLYQSRISTLPIQ